MIMGDEEIFTNMTFIQISTLPFELRPTNMIELNQDGEIENVDSTINQNNITNVNIQNDNVDNEHPPDAFMNRSPVQIVRQNKNLTSKQLMSSSQIATYKNHDGKAKSYDKISLFSLRPPELLNVFTNPNDYFRYCSIDNRVLHINTIDKMLDIELKKCRWIDCLGRQVKLRGLAFEEVKSMIQNNLNNLDPVRDKFAFDMNELIENMIDKIKDKNNVTSTIIMDEINHLEENFIDISTEENLLPIPVLSMISPENPIHFLIHIILSMGKYDTEIDALTHPSFRDCFKEVQLIGEDEDEYSLKQYVNDLTKSYIESQVVYYPNSMKKSETYIVMAHRIFEDVIIHNSIPIFELPPYSMNALRDAKTEENKKFWICLKRSQFTSAISSLQHMATIPSEEEISNVDRESHIEWNPLLHFSQFENQSEESYIEQKRALSLVIKIIDKYRATTGNDSKTYTKNVIIYGAPGTGKSFIGQMLVLYCLAKGMNVMSTSLLGVRANALGGIHIHKLFMIPTDDKLQLSPFKSAEKALEKIRRKINILHILLTMDVLFIVDDSNGCILYWKV